MAVWRERVADPGLSSALTAAGYGELFARILAVRGIAADDAEHFLSPSLKNLSPSAELPGVVAAAAVILDAIESSAGRTAPSICIFGDYDCDGISAAAIMISTLDAVAPGMAQAFIPHRMTEGYGMTEASVGRMLKEVPGVRLVITVDNGINSLAHVRSLKAQGISVVITDHHLPGEDAEDLRAEVAGFVNPKVEAPKQLEGLCGAGVAFMLAGEIVAQAKDRGLYDGPPLGGPLLVLAGLATVTDIMPLTGQNRILVAEALRRFRQLAPVGLRELYDRACKNSAPILSSRDFGFLLGPRINAAGRMASGEEALKLLLSADREEARMLALAVDNYNIDRKMTEGAMTEYALSLVEPDVAAQVIDIPNGHQGVAGIVASRILESCPHGPVAIVVSGHGSCRAPEGFNVRDILQNAAAALEHFGGHAQAGGFSVRDGMFAEFKRLFTEGAAAQAAKLKAANCAPDDVFYDAEITEADIALDFAESIERLEPFGEGNEEPVFRIDNVVFSSVRTLGADGKHLSVELAAPSRLRAVWWGHGDMAESIRSNSANTFDLLFKFSVSDYGSRHVELTITDLKIHDERMN